MLMKTGLSATAEPSSLPENFDSGSWKVAFTSSAFEACERVLVPQDPNCRTFLAWHVEDEIEKKLGFC